MSQTQTETTTQACGWKCGDTMPDHKHYAVLCYDLDGKRLGRLTPDGSATSRNIFAAVFSHARATEIAGKINEQGQFTAKVITF